MVSKIAESSVSVVIPVKDEPYIGTLVDDIHKELAGITHEVIVVYGDRSKTVPDVKNARVHRIYGDSLENAVLSGFSVAEGDQIVVMDGDGSHSPKVIPKLLAALNGADLAVASRLVDDNPIKMSPYRRLVTKMFARLGRATGANSSDPMSGFFALKKKVLEGIQFKPFKWKVLYEILRSKGDDIEVAEVPYVFERRNFGSTKSSTKMGLAILWDIFSASSRLRLFSRIGLTAAIILVLLFYLNVGELAQIFLRIKLHFLGLAVVSYVLMSAVMALRLSRVLTVFGAVKKRFVDVFWSHTFGMLAANITPAKIGYLASVSVLSNRTGVEKKGCLSAVLGIQSVELIVKAFLAMFSLIIIMGISGTVEIVSPAIIGIITVAALGVLGLSTLFFKPYWLEDVPVLGDVAGHLVKYPKFKSKFFEIALASIFCWLLRGLEWTFLGMALGINVPFYIFFILHPLLTAVRFLPLTPSSLGVFEIALIWGFASFGVMPEVSFAFGLLDRVDNFPDFIALKELLREGVVF